MTAVPGSKGLLRVYRDLDFAEARVKLYANPMARWVRDLAKVQLFEPWPLTLQTHSARAPVVTALGCRRDTTRPSLA